MTARGTPEGGGLVEVLAWTRAWTWVAVVALVAALAGLAADHRTMILASALVLLGSAGAQAVAMVWARRLRPSGREGD